MLPVIKYQDVNGVWQDISGRVRAYSYTAGRTDETAGVSPGSATITLDNNDGTFVNSTGSVNLLTLGTKVQILANGAARWTGQIKGSPLTFPSAEGTQATVVVNAVDALEPLSRLTARTSITESMLLACRTRTPSAYWPLSEGVGAARFSELTGNGAASSAATHTTDTLSTAGVTNFQTASMTPGDANLLPYRVSVYSPSAYTNTVLTLWVNIPATAGNGDIIRLTSGNLENTVLRIATTGGQVWAATQIGGNSATTATITPAPGWHLLTAVLTASGLTFYCDNTATATVALPTGTPLGWINLTWEGVAGASTPFPLASVALMTSASFTASTVANLVAGAAIGNQSSTNALAALASWINPSPATSFDSQTNGGNVADVATAGNTYLTLMGNIAAGEDGPLFVDRSGTIRNLTHLSLADAATAAPVAAFDNGDVEPDLTLARDTQFLFTRAEATSNTGTIQVSQRNTSTFGTYLSQFSVNGNDNQALDAANWRTFRYGDVDYSRLSQVAVDLLSSADAVLTSALGLNVGSRMTLSGLPVLGGYTSADLIVTGFTEDWDINHWTIKFNTVPSANYQGWVLEDPTYGLLEQTTVLYY